MKHTHIAWIGLLIFFPLIFGGVVQPLLDPRAVHVEGTDVQTQATFDDVDHSPDAVGEILYDNTVTGYLDGIWAWYDDDEIRYFVDFDAADLPGAGEDDYVLAYDAGNDKNYWKADATGAGGGDPVLVDTTEITDGSGVDLTSGVGVDITLNAGASPDTATFALDGTEIDDITWSDNANASNTWTFDVSGTDHTMVAGNAVMTFSQGVTVTGALEGGTLTEGGVAVHNNDEMDASSELAAIIDDETGTGVIVFGTSPTFTTQFTLTPQATPTTDADGEIAVDTDGWGTNFDAWEIFNGTASAYLVATTASDSPTDGQVPKWNTGGEITWEDDASGAGGGDPVLIDGVAITDGSGVDLIGGAGVDITLNAGVSPDTATFDMDTTEKDNATWSDGSNASNTWTFDVSGTDHTMVAGNALMTFSQGVTVSGTLEGATLTEGGTGVYNTTESDAAYQPLEATLTDIADGTIAENLVNTANPWADNEVADDITITAGSQIASGNPQFTTIELGHASDSTIARTGAGTLTIEGNQIYEAGDEGTIAAAIAEGELADAIIVDADIKDDVIQEPALNTTNAAGAGTDNYLLSYNHAATNFTWVASSAFDSTTIDNTTWSDGTQASNVWTFDVSGTDHTMTFGSGLVTFSNAVTVTGELTATDMIDVEDMKHEDHGDITYASGNAVIDTDVVDSQHYAANSIDDEHLNITEWMVLPIQSAKLSGAFVTDGDATAGATLDAGEGSWRLLFDASTDEAALWQFRMPSTYTSGLTAKIQYSMASGTANEVEFEVDIMAVSDGDAADIVTASFDTENVGSATVPGTVGYLDEISITLTNADSVAAGDMVWVVLSTDADDATNDDATGDREVVSFSLEWTR